MNIHNVGSRKGLSNARAFPYCIYGKSGVWRAGKDIGGWRAKLYAQGDYQGRDLTARTLTELARKAETA